MLMSLTYLPVVKYSTLLYGMIGERICVCVWMRSTHACARVRCYARGCVPACIYACAGGEGNEKKQCIQAACPLSIPATEKETR